MFAEYALPRGGACGATVADWNERAHPARSPATTKGRTMGTVARITTITARSEKSFEDAIREGIARSNKTLRKVSGAWVKEQKVEVSDGTITAWHVVLEITFVLDD